MKTTDGRDAWVVRSACRGLAPTTFFAGDDEYSTEFASSAKAVCSRCPVTKECLRHALLSREQYGIWGGLTPSERKFARLPKLTPWAS